MRAQFEFSEATIKLLDKLKEETNAVSRAAVVRSAMYAYNWIVEEVKKGNRIVSVDSSTGDLQSEYRVAELEAVRLFSESESKVSK